MNAADKTPHYIMVEFLRPSGEAVCLADLGVAFMKAQAIPPGNGPLAFRIAVEKKISKAGNAFYDYVQNAIPFPDGLSTTVRVAGAIVPMGTPHPSQRGHPTREGSAPVMVAGIPYTATVYLTESRSPFYVKVIAHKTPSSDGGIPTRAPRGGRIVT
jgi:hypothetical protein